MPKLLIAVATRPELQPFYDFLGNSFETQDGMHFRDGELEIYLLVSGVGLMQSGIQIMEAALQFRPQFALQAGIAGAYDEHLALRTLVWVKEECLGDTGAEDGEDFLDTFELGLQSSDQIFRQDKLINPMDRISFLPSCPRVSGLSVNRTAGSEATISARRKKFDCQIESMEGAAFHYVCLKSGIPFLQIRSISNYVEPRDKSKWDIAGAISVLNTWLIRNIRLFNHLTEGSHVQTKGSPYF